MSDNLTNVTLQEMEEAHYDKTCPAKAFQQATVCVPVTVVPFAEAGKPKTTCCGDPVIMPGKDTCSGRPNGTCNFTISQRICVEVPVIFGARTVVGAPSVDCEKVSDKDICKKCDDYKDC